MPLGNVAYASKDVQLEQSMRTDTTREDAGNTATELVLTTC